MTRVKTGMSCTDWSESATHCATTVDGVLHTQWVSSSPPAWIRVTFSTNHIITFIRLLQATEDAHQMSSITLSFSDNSTQTVSILGTDTSAFIVGQGNTRESLHFTNLRNKDGNVVLIYR